MIRYAKVTSVSSQGYKVTFLGEENESQTIYKKLTTYTPKFGDVVAFIVDTKGKYLCIGTVD